MSKTTDLQMIDKKNFPFYVLLILSFLGFKLAYSLSSIDDLKFVLLPVSRLVELFTGARFQFLSGEGYFFHDLNIIIDKSCSGVNYLLICFIVISLVALKHLTSNVLKAFSLILSLLLAFIFALLVNSFRICSSLMLGNIGGDFFAGPIVHEAAGVLTNITFLIILYSSLDNVFIKYFKHAKLS